MRVHIVGHAVSQARERFGFNPKQVVDYWFRNVDTSVFNQGPGVYNVVVGGAVLFACAYDPDNNEVRILTIAHAKPFNCTGFCGPLTDRDGELISYSTRVERSGPGRKR